MEKRACNKKLEHICTFDFSQRAAFENQVSSINTSGARGFPLNATAAIEDVITTLLIDGSLAHDLRIIVK